MKNLQLRFLALMLYTAGLEAKAYKDNVATYEIGPGAEVKDNKITYKDPDCPDGLDCTTTKTCSKTGYTPSLSEDKKYFACCAKGQRLLGSPDTAFDCCADGHDLVGSSKTGYHCCPTGFAYDGKQCKKLCENGKALVDGKCVCPKGTTETSDGTCEKKPDEPGKCDEGECSSGLESGKCYIFKADNGNRLGLAVDNVYYAAAESMTQRYGKFQLCLDEQCTPGEPVNPSTEVYIRDTYGDLATGANKNQWLNHAINGGHISRTPMFSLAGHFSISKWPCGKYCLGGFTEGVGPACPAITPALTFYTQDPQMCVEFEFTEVPCDLKSDANNCIWKSGDQCCNKIDCSKPDCSKENASSSSSAVPQRPLSLPDGVQPDPTAADVSSPDEIVPNGPSPNDELTDISTPEDASSSNASPDADISDDDSSDSTSRDATPPENPNGWSTPLSYSTTLLLAAASLALSALIPRLPKKLVPQILAPRDQAAQKPSGKEITAPKDIITERETPSTPKKDTPPSIPEMEDISDDNNTELSPKTSESISSSAATTLSRYTTKSRTIVSTSKINHNQVMSEHMEYESSETTPEELDL